MNILRTKVLTGVWDIPSVSQIFFMFLFAEASDPLWFILIILELYLLYPLIVKGYNFFVSKKCSWLFVIIALALQIIWQIFGNYQLQLWDFSVDLESKLFLCGFFYFALGIYICDHYHSIKEWVLARSVWLFAIPTIILTIVFTAMRVITGSYTPFENVIHSSFGYIFTPILYVLSFALLFVLSHRILQSKMNVKWLMLIGLYSFGVYLVHPVLQIGIEYIIEMFGITPQTVIFYPLSYLAILVLSMIAVYIIRKFPFYRYIIG